MKVKSKKQNLSNFNINGNYSLYKTIVDDMKLNGGELVPAENWGVEIANHNGQKFFEGEATEYVEDLRRGFDLKYASLQAMLDPWVGCIGMQSVTPESLAAYIPFIKSIDRLGLLSDVPEDLVMASEELNGITNTDLGTLIDLNLISTYSKTEPLTFLEVGGGYGRLAEGVFSVFGSVNPLFYLMVDAVPASLLYSYEYMKATFPELRVGFYYNGDQLDPSLWDCYVMPAWHYKVHPKLYDVCINVQSMQEMRQAHVDYYLNLFDDAVSDTGIVYLSNEKDYIFKGDWNYSKSWNLLLKTRTPRSWTRNSPTEIFSKVRDSERSDMAMEWMYSAQLLKYDEASSHQLSAMGYVES